MSYQGTLNIIDRLSEDHDIEVLFWGDELKSKLNERESTVSIGLYCKRSCMITAVYSCQQATHSTMCAHGSLMAATDSDDQSEVASAPEYSPMTVSSDSSDAPHDDTKHDSDGTKSSCSEEEECDRLG